jgi:hypothetical protein
VTIQDIQIKRGKLEETIFQLLANFEQETEVVINNIDIIRHQITAQDKLIYHILSSIEIHLIFPR